MYQGISSLEMPSMWKICITVLLQFLFGIDNGSTGGSHFQRRSDVGYFSVNLLAVTRPNAIRCAGSCTRFTGCSVISFSKLQNLCMLSNGSGTYVADTDWRTFSLRSFEHAIETFSTSLVQESTTTLISETGISQLAETDVVETHSTTVNEAASATGLTETITTGRVTEAATTTGVTYTNTTDTVTEAATTTGMTETITIGRVTKAATNTAVTNTTDTVTQAAMTTGVTETVTAERFTETTTEASQTTAEDISCRTGYMKTPLGRCYHLAAGLRTFRNAHQICGNYDGHLATITSEAETLEVVRILQARTDLTRNVWLGGSDINVEGTWTWVTDEAFGYTNWLQDYPVDIPDDSDCLVFSIHHRWKWTDQVCSQTSHYLCEYEPR